MNDLSYFTSFLLQIYLRIPRKLAIYEAHRKKHTYFEVTRMSKLSTTVFTGKSALVVVNQHVIVQTMLSCEGSITNKAHKWLDTWKDKWWFLMSLILY